MAARKRSAATEIARCVSILGHPFAIAALLVALAASHQRTGAEATRVVLLVVLLVILPLFVFMWRKWRSGEWSTIDASRSTDRPSFYRTALLLVALLTAVFVVTGQGSAMLRGCIAVAALVTLLAILNRWIKLSNHMAFALFAAVLTCKFAPGWSLSLALFAPLLGWSRLALSRHTLPEVIGGTLLGAAVAGATLSV